MGADGQSYKQDPMPDEGHYENSYNNRSTATSKVDGVDTKVDD